MGEQSKSGIYKTLYILLGIISLVIGLTVAKVLGIFNKGLDLESETLKDKGVYIFSSPRQLSAFSLTSHDAQPFELEQFKQHWSLVFFGYTSCPDVCPTTLSMLNKVKTLSDGKGYESKDFQTVMMTVDPARDTVEQLKTYVPFFNPSFIGVTGNVDTIAALATEFHVVFAKSAGESDDPDVYHMDHSGHIAIVNPHGLYHGFMRPPFDIGLISDVMEALYQQSPTPATP